MKHYDFKPVLRNYLMAEGVIILFALINLVQGIKRQDVGGSIAFLAAGLIMGVVLFLESLDYKQNRTVSTQGVIQEFGRFVNSNKAILIANNGQKIKFRIMGMPKKQMKTLLGKRAEVYRTKTFKNALEIKVWDQIEGVDME